MTVRITPPPLAASPNSGTLPLPIVFTYFMSTNIPTEQATVVYEIADGDNVGVNVAGNKVLMVVHPVDSVNPQEFNDNATLVSCSPGQPFTGLLVIKQAITDESGSVLISRCSVDIVAGA